MGCWAWEIEIGLLIALDRVETVRIVVYDKAKGCVEYVCTVGPDGGRQAVAKAYNSSNHYDYLVKKDTTGPLYLRQASL
jgi:hypothetical protein